MKPTKLNAAEYERRKMFESHNYRQKVKKMIELQQNFQLEKLTKKQKEVAKYFAEPLGNPISRPTSQNESLDRVLKEVIKI